MERWIVWVNTPEACRSACDQLCEGGPDSYIAIDLEGTDLNRKGQLCLVQAACKSGPVYLFDILALTSEAFDNGLRHLLEDTGPVKLVFDPRSDADVLLYRYKIRLANVIDIQVLYCWATRKCGQHLPGMGKATGELSHIPRDQLNRLVDLKEEGKSLFAPDLGGTKDIWEQRPLPEILQQYAASDVDVLFLLFSEWSSQVDEEQLQEVSHQRIRRQVCSPDTIQDARREFPMPIELCTIFIGGVSTRLAAENQLHTHFGQYGQVAKVQHKSGERYAFIEYYTKEGAVRAVQEANHFSARSGGLFKEVSWPKRVREYIESYVGPSDNMQVLAKDALDTIERNSISCRSAAIGPSAANSLYCSRALFSTANDPPDWCIKKEPDGICEPTHELGFTSETTDSKITGSSECDSCATSEVHIFEGYVTDDCWSD